VIEIESTENVNLLPAKTTVSENEQGSLQGWDRGRSYQIIDYRECEKGGTRARCH